MSKLLTSMEAAELMAVSASTFYHYVSANRIIPLRREESGRNLFAREDVGRLMKEIAEEKKEIPPPNQRYDLRKEIKIGIESHLLDFLNKEARRLQTNRTELVNNVLREYWAKCRASE